MYIIENISGYLSVAGLYPGKTKKVSKITPELKELSDKFLISISEVKESNKPKKKEEDNKSNNERRGKN